MALTPILRAVAEGMARDAITYARIRNNLQDAAENGPWRYSPDEVSTMWLEMIELVEKNRERDSILESEYDPWIVADVVNTAVGIVSSVLS